jgi:hypothetical protein
MVETIFSEAAQKPIEVEIMQTIGRAMMYVTFS